MTEMVYVINLASLEKMPGLQSRNFSRDGLDLVGLTVAIIEGFFTNRKEAETSPQYKQIIPYVIFASDDDQYLVYQRQGSEERLSNLYSMGLGGHINPQDAEGCDWKNEMLWHNMKRELSEEISLKGITVSDILARTSMKGILYLPDSPVNSVHLGVVYEASIKREDKAKFSMKSEGKNLEWKSAEDLEKLGESLEGWSRVVLENL